MCSSLVWSSQDLWLLQQASKKKISTRPSIFYSRFFLKSTCALLILSSLDIKTASAESNQTGFIQLSTSYFSEGMDVFDFGEKISSSTRPQRATETAIDVGLYLSPRVLLQYQFQQDDGVATRDIRPFKLDSGTTAHQLSLEFAYDEFLGHGVELLAHFTLRDQDELRIDCFERLGVVLGGTCPEADFRLVDGDRFLSGEQILPEPLLVTNGDSSSVRIGVRAWKNYRFLGLVVHETALKISDVSSSSSSALFLLESPFVLGSRYQDVTLGEVIESVQLRAPQDKPWREYAWSYSLTTERNLSSNTTAALSLSYARVWRDRYKRRQDQPNWDQNVGLSAIVKVALSESWTVFAGGELFSNYLLGVDEIAYNQTTSKYFEHPFGRVRAGLRFSF